MIDIYSKDHSRLPKKVLQKELVITILFTLITFVLSYFYIIYLIDNFLPIYHKEVDNRYIFEYILFLVITSVLIWGSLIYEFCRLGYLIRLLKFEEPNKIEVDDLFFKRERSPSIKILVPSYQEEESTIYQTLFSAATQDYPEKDVILLIDDSPNPKTETDKNGLELSRKIPLDIMKLLSKEKKYLSEQYQSYIEREKKDIEKEKKYLKSNFYYVSNWFLVMAENHKINDHTDKLFVKKILIDPGEKYKKEAELSVDKINDFESVELNYKKLISIFNANLSSFERKKYINLSHEPNKAMNINSYISLMGYYYDEIRKEKDLFIHKKKSIGGLDDKKIEDPDYILTLDADSIIVPEYTKNLIFLMEQKKFEKVGIIQSPYSAIDGTENIFEKLAGATTDIQYIIHQGFTFFDSTFWVGANAIIRKRALDDIKETVDERGFKIERFISDHTVIEDTESSVDLVNKKWDLYNYPRRISYSATPPDYGSLLIQRRRWANGGLIIFPKLLIHLLKKIVNPFYFLKVAFIRSHYLLSIALVNFGILILFIYPFENIFLDFSVIGIGLSYFYLYYRDLIIMNYNKLDLFRIYALNLLLIPINIGGVLKSIQQGIFGIKTPFVRTPKVEGRTSAPAGYILLTIFLVLLLVNTTVLNFSKGLYFLAAFIFLNVLFFIYALKIMGFKEGIEDIKMQFLSRINTENILEKKEDLNNEKDFSDKKSNSKSTEKV